MRKSNRHTARLSAVQRRAGRTQVEVLAVFSLLLLLGVSIFSLSASGSAAYLRMEQNRVGQGELRVSLSFLQMKLRQSDASGAIALAPNPVNGEAALVITEVFEGTAYETWIYHDEGMLREALVLAGESFDNQMAFPIATVDGLSLTSNASGTGLLVRAWTKDGRGRVIRAQTGMAVRSGGVR